MRLQRTAIGVCLSILVALASGCVGPVAINEHRFVSASGEGTARVELKIELTENAKAFYKKSGSQVALRRSTGQQTATFDYQRKSREEYVDIYVVPDYADAAFKPKTFLRIRLSHPYTAERLPWNPWYVRLWAALSGKSE